MLKVTTASSVALPLGPKACIAAVAFWPPSVTMTVPVGSAPYRAMQPVFSTTSTETLAPAATLVTRGLTVKVVLPAVTVKEAAAEAIEGL